MVPKIKVGIVFNEKISFRLNGKYKHIQSGMEYEGYGEAIITDDTINIRINNKEATGTLPFDLEPVSYAESDFDLFDVTIGINFHWERKEDQKFKGALRFIKENNKITAINILNLEDYLISVISSEMSATSTPELLKAHAVISRSWLLAQIEKGDKIQKKGNYTTTFETTQERVKWYDREDHSNFDVCADDHCQRYQGITRASTSMVTQAINETYGKVLVYNNSICDARFSKCCGGVSELFENVWEPESHPYLTKVIDASASPEGFDMNLKLESNAVNWITNSPQAYCNTTNNEVLGQVLNDYDQETPDFYRWEVKYSQTEIRNLLRKRVGIDVGDIIDIVPVERGESARLIRLKIVGSNATKTIGKELEIRKALSESHLYSSAFIIKKGLIVDGLPQTFTLLGAGWGHGVGLCQIGAAVMGDKGFSHEQILLHYFRGATLEKRY